MGGNAEIADEDAPHGVDGAETAGAGHPLERRFRIRKHASRRIDARRIHECGGRVLQFSPEHPREIARAHPGAKGQGIDGQIL